MAFDYPEIFNYLTLQLKGLESLATETAQAINSLEYIRYLLERHQQITLRLSEITAKLSSLDHRIVELNEIQKDLDRKSQNKSRPSGLPQIRSLYSQNQKNGKSSKIQGSGQTPPQSESPSPVPRNQQNLIQLELMNLLNQHATQETRQQELEKSLQDLEAQLLARGFKPGAN